MSAQYKRVASLVVKNLQTGLDLSQMQFKFEVNQSDFATPNNAVIKVYNLSDATSKRILGEFTEVILGAAYEPELPRTIFKGTIKQVRRGRDTPVDKYTEIIAADGDEAYNFGFVNQTLAEGSTWSQQMNVILGGMTGNGVNSVYGPGVFVGPPLIRPKVYFGLARDYANRLADNMDTTWSIQQGVLTFSKQTGYLPGEAVVLTAKTGLIGQPEQTDNGIRVRCLLNSKIKTGCAIKLDNRSIQAARIDVAWSAINRLPAISDDGLYKVLVAEHVGNTRGEDWYSDLTCLAINPASGAVQPYYAGRDGSSDRTRGTPD